MAVAVEERFSSTPWAIIVPLALPGEVVRVKVYRNARMHSVADLVTVVTPNLDLRDDSRVQCRYFGRCAGCQYQVCYRLKILNVDPDTMARCCHMIHNSLSNATSS